MGAWHSENPPADPPAASEVPATEAPATPAASVMSVTTPQKVAPEEMTEKPELVAEESEEPPGSRASELWPDLVLPTATADSLLTCRCRPKSSSSVRPRHVAWQLTYVWSKEV